MAEIKVTSKPTFRAINGRFTKANANLLRNAQIAMGVEGDFLAGEVKAELRKKTGQESKIERGIKHKTAVSSGRVILTVETPDRAAPHRIYAKNKKALVFTAGGTQIVVPKAGGFPSHYSNGVLFSGKGYVDHPGGSLVPLLNPILKRVNNRWSYSRGRMVLNRISSRWVTEVSA